MALNSTKDIVPISQARARLTELADDVSRSGHEKVFTKTSITARRCVTFTPTPGRAPFSC